LYLAFDCGPFGYKGGPIHGHADALAFDLYAYGRSLLTDCGTYSYHVGRDWRNYFRGTRAHNTIVIDGEDQSILVGSRRVDRVAQATLHHWMCNTDADFVDGSHDGYRRLAKPVTHRRQIVFVKPEYWIVVDLLTGPPARHHLEHIFHLVPSATPHLDRESKQVRVDQEGVPAITIAPTEPLPTKDLAGETGMSSQKAGIPLQVDVICGATDPIQGWVSFRSGEKLPAPVIRYSAEVQIPARLVTVLYPHPPDAEAAAGRLCASQLHVYASTGESCEAEVCALSIETAEHVDTCVLVHCDPHSPSSALGSWRTVGLEGDGMLAFVRQRKSDGLILRATTCEGHSLSFQGQPVGD
jgi:hypothetical protein